MLNDTETLSLILKLLREKGMLARSDLQRLSGLGRGLLAERVGQLLRANVIVEGDLGASTGGRAARELRLNTNAGVVFVAQAHLDKLMLGIADLNGRVVANAQDPGAFGAGPDSVLDRLSEGWHRLAREQGLGTTPVWAVGLGLPAHVDFETGTLIESPSLPSTWKHSDFRRELARTFLAPAWIDTNDNLLALGEMKAGIARRHQTFVYVVADMAIGSGLVVNGKPFRGHQGAAGNIGHIRAFGSADTLCRCGRRGCLEAVASGEALVRQATDAARAGRSPYLADRLRSRDVLSVDDIADGVRDGDDVALGLLTDAGHRIGETLASVVNVINPSLIVIGGCLPATGDLLIAAIKEALFKQSLPFVTRELHVIQAPAFENVGLIGAAHMAVEQIFRPEALSRWIERSAPAIEPILILSYGRV